MSEYTNLLPRTIYTLKDLFNQLACVLFMKQGNKEVLRVTSQDTWRLIKPFSGSTLKLKRNTVAPL